MIFGWRAPPIYRHYRQCETRSGQSLSTKSMKREESFPFLDSLKFRIADFIISFRQSSGLIVRRRIGSVILHMYDIILYSGYTVYMSRRKRIQNFDTRVLPSEATPVRLQRWTYSFVTRHDSLSIREYDPLLDGCIQASQTYRGRGGLLSNIHYSDNCGDAFTSSSESWNYHAFVHSSGIVV